MDPMTMMMISALASGVGKAAGGGQQAPGGQGPAPPPPFGAGTAPLQPVFGPPPSQQQQSMGPQMHPGWMQMLSGLQL